MLRISSSRTGAVAAARFSTSASRRIDLSSLYGKITGWRRKTARTVVDPTADLDAERAPTSSDESKAVEKKTSGGEARRLQVLGLPPKVSDDWPEVRPFAEFEAWPTNHHRADISVDKISEAVAAVKDNDFANFEQRLAAVKSVSQALRVAVPDAVFTKLDSPEALQAHLASVAVPFDERQPDAVYLRAEDFEGTNISLADPVAERRGRRERKRELLAQAQQAQVEQADSLLRQ